MAGLTLVGKPTKRFRRCREHVVLSVAGPHTDERDTHCTNKSVRRLQPDEKGTH